MTDKLIKEMSVQQTDAQVQEKGAQLEAKKANEESEKYMTIKIEPEKELGAVKPAMEAAAAAVDYLSKVMLSELKNFGKPPAGVDMVTNSCLITQFRGSSAESRLPNRPFKERLNFEYYEALAKYIAYLTALNLT